jgi:hypothetical protein
VREREMLFIFDIQVVFILDQGPVKMEIPAPRIFSLQIGQRHNVAVFPMQTISGNNTAQ